MLKNITVMLYPHTIWTHIATIHYHMAMELLIVHHSKTMALIYAVCLGKASQNAHLLGSPSFLFHLYAPLFL